MNPAISFPYSNAKLRQESGKPHTTEFAIADRGEQSFFVGDAAGRPSDHSDVDKLFASAIKIRFYTPEVVSCQVPIPLF